MDALRQIKDTINVRVANNTSLSQNVNLLGGTSDPLGVPPNIIYEWDLSGENYIGINIVKIQISSTLNPIVVIYTVSLNGNNIESVAYALNTLGFGNFQISGNIIYVSNNFYIYSKIETA
jgi:hypothetical protein